MGIFVISPDGHDYELNEKKDENETYKIPETAEIQGIQRILEKYK